MQDGGPGWQVIFFLVRRALNPESSCRKSTEMHKACNSKSIISDDESSPSFVQDLTCYCNTVSKSFPQCWLCTFPRREASVVICAKDTFNTAYLPIVLKALCFISEILYFLKSHPDKPNRCKIAVAELEGAARTAEVSSRASFLGARQVEEKDRPRSRRAFPRGNVREEKR